jgi:hypothetical protein
MGPALRSYFSEIMMTLGICCICSTSVFCKCDNLRICDVRIPNIFLFADLNFRKSGKINTFSPYQCSIQCSNSNLYLKIV